ncbi:hypothetical protein BT96DRAFT_91009 [Gymnopus androsaceus JB14]|uniref:TPX2 C-terminal domain-containing protein n=1 Tax=Gymnopus androsaceus JB14 TaxID=1447944 RepID=A0A6A4HIN8_9AGAR|nr:hypothetical protein BT96DRAFT_91009 [Gymnopus androsaceus JB14]
MNVISTARGGLAERLVMYSQNLAGSQELSNLRAGTVSSALTVSSPFHQISSHLPHGASPKASTRDMVPCLTLSQLSPSKTRRRSSTPEPKSLRSSDGDASPMRQSHKRPGSPVSNTQLRKKEKISTISSSSARAILPGSRAIIKRRTPSVNSNSASVMAKTKPMRHVSGPSRTTRGPPVVSKGSLGGSSIAQSHTVVHSSGTLMDSGGSSKLSVEQSEGSTKITRSHPTRPVEFNFRTNVRSEAGRPSSNAREPEDSSQRKLKHHTPYTIPNFKSSHAAQDALLTSLKGQITPVVPLPIEMHTDVRARERSKFNERVREKEAEMDRALEERKRQQAEEEERENRELRKKAIPKAHPVPDWYKDVPRRKEQRSQSGSEVDR